MTQLFRLLAMAVGLALASPVVARGTHPSDFTDTMMQMLATDPAGAGDLAERELARLTAQRISPRDARRAAALWVLAQSKFRVGESAEAQAILLRAQAAAPPGRDGARLRAQIALLRGLMVRASGNYGGALQIYRQAQRGFIAAGDDRGHALALQAVGILYSDAADSDNAIRYFTLAQNVYDGDDLFRLSLNNNMGVALQYADRYEESATRFAKAITIADRIGMNGFLIRVKLNMARSEIESGRLFDAENILKKLSDLSTDLSDIERRETLQLRALIAKRRGNNTIAKQLIDEALTGVDLANTRPEFRQIHATAYEIYRAHGLTRLALAQFEAVRRLEQQEATLTASNRASLLAAQFQFSAQNARIDRLKAERLQRDIAYQRMIAIVGGIAGLLILAALGALLVMALRSRNRARRDGEQLREVNERLERALAAKTEFLASTSHELRTPLNGILGMAQIMLTDSSMAPRIREQVQLLHDAGSSMRALVDDILDVAKAEHGRFAITPSPTDPRIVAERVVALFSDQAQAQGISIALSTTIADQPLMLDPDRVTQILYNLVGNALKFTQDGRIDVSLAEDKTASGHHLLIAVRDTGIGIGAEWHDSVFEMFKQVDGTRTRKHGGTGLGLAICRQLARAMGGDIALESAAGAGSCFTVRIPWQAADASHFGYDISFAGHDAAAGGAAPDHRQQTVVIAEAPLRASLLSAIVRLAGQEPVILREAGAIASTLSMGTPCLIDGEALDYAQAMLGPMGCAMPGRLIIAGGDEGAISQANVGNPSFNGTTVHVPFVRNAILEALLVAEDAHLSSDSDNIGLHHGGDALSPVQPIAAHPRRRSA